MRTSLLLLVAVLTVGCSRRSGPPETMYDQDLIDTAREVALERRMKSDAAPGEDEAQKPTGECNRETGGCPPGYLCWDSWFCKRGAEDQCSASGDRRCHKLCSDGDDCPRSSPLCAEKPIFKGSEEGTAEKFCISEGEH